MAAGCIKSYSLRSGRMSDAQKRSYQNLAPYFCIPYNFEPDFQRLFGNSNPLIIEIGFGSGFATASIAEDNPGINYLGIEVYRPGIGRLLWEIEKRQLKNIRIIEGDAAQILEQKIGNNTVSAFHIFFPDPWPIKRHHKRRLITRPFTDLLAAKLLPGGYIYMATDWADYGAWALGELSATPGLVNKYETFANDEHWRPKTEFEQKGIQKNHEVKELFFKKG